MMLELVGQIVVPGAVAFGTALAWFHASGRKSGVVAAKMEVHLADENVHCAPEHHERLVRIEERQNALTESVDEMKGDLRRVLNGRVKPAPRRRS